MQAKLYEIGLVQRRQPYRESHPATAIRPLRRDDAQFAENIVEG
jgi:hypothetical protein